MSDNEWMQMKDVAALMGVSRHKAANLCAALGVTVRDGGRWRLYRRADVLAAQELWTAQAAQPRLRPLALIDPWQKPAPVVREVDAPAALIDRRCLNCSAPFKAASRFLRLCERCRPRTAGAAFTVTRRVK